MRDDRDVLRQELIAGRRDLPRIGEVVPGPSAVLPWLLIDASGVEEAAVSALDTGQLPCSSGERHVLRLSASIAAGVPVSLSDALPGLDARNAALVTRAVAHATGPRP